MTQCSSRPAALSGWDADTVIAELEEAMATLRALPSSGPSTRMAQLRLEILPDGEPATAANTAPWRPRPSAAAIDRMDAVLAWLAWLPNDRIILRRLVALRAQTSPSGRPMSWRRVGEALRTDNLACQRWHGQAISILVRELRARRVPLPHPDR